MAFNLEEKLEESEEYLIDKLKTKPEIGLILGSGLGVLAEKIKGAKTFGYEEIPHFPTSTVEGHAGQLVAGRLEGASVVAMQGRFHYYEGYDLKTVVFPVRVMNYLGAKKIIVTNSAGGVNRNFNVGDLMLIRDHLNLMGDNPLIGSNEEELGPRFPDMSEAYDRGLIDLAKRTAKELGINLRKGVYAGMTGPSYETPAEISMLERLGGDAVGMSTVPEVIAANHLGMRVLGISCITNMAAGVLPEALSHEEVIETTKKVKPKFIKLVRNIIKEMRE